MYSSQGNSWKITDFGITAEGTSKKAVYTRYARGTSSYRAPELLKTGQYTNKVDIWALGCIVYELFASRKAFEDDFAVFQFSVSKERIEFRIDGVIEKQSKTALLERLQAMLNRNPQSRPSAKEICCDRFWAPPIAPSSPTVHSEKPYSPSEAKESPQFCQSPTSHLAIVSTINAMSLITGIIDRTVPFGFHVINNSTLYAEEVQGFITTIRLQIGIWEGAWRKLQERRIKHRLRDEDLMWLAYGSAQLHRSMQKFVACNFTNKAESGKILALHSADELIARLDEQGFLENRSGIGKEESGVFRNNFEDGSRFDSGAIE